MRWLSLILAASVLLASAVAAQTTAPEESALRSYRIGIDDKVRVRVEELPELDSELEVATDGTVDMPQVGRVEAQGLTESELALRIRSRLQAGGLRRATVSVSLTAQRSQPVAVLGAVRQPGSLFVPSGIKLMEVLLRAGGLATNNGRYIVVRRRAENGLSDEVRIAARDLFEAGDPTVNIPILAGDLINVPPAEKITLHFLGAAAKAGTLTFQSTDRVTLLIAIAQAGGLSETASKKIRIRRLLPTGERHELVVDYRRILNGDDPDPDLQDGDLIIVKESFF